MKKIYLYPHIIVLVLLAVLTRNESPAQGRQLRNNIIGSAYQDNKSYNFLERICDEAGGRLPGTKANEKAMNILREELKSLGLESKTEEFNMPGWVRGDDEVIVKSPVNKKLKAVALGYTDSTAEFTAKVVDAQYGLDENYRNIDAAGKIVMVSQERPPQHDQPLRYEVIEIAARHGARAVLFVNDKSGSLNLAGVANFQGLPSAVPAFSITLEEGRWLTRLLKKSISPEITIRTRSYCTQATSANISVTFPGELKGRIVVGAHFDSWDLSQGAIDNGQGSAVLFDVARLLMQYSPRNYYTIELVWLNAEELGLWGSKRYVEMHKDEDIKAMINMDMPGSPTGFNAMGFDNFVPYLQTLASELDGFNMSAGVTSQPWTNSDHMYFIFEGIPSFTLHGTLDRDMYWYYHDAGDTFDKVNKKYLSDAAAVITILTCWLANGKDLPFEKMSRKNVADMLKKYKLDERLKKQKEWKFDE